MPILLKGWQSTPSSSADGRAGSTKRSPQLSAELDRPNDHLGYPPSWIDQTTTSAIRRAEPVQLGGWPSWIDHATSSAMRRAGLVKFGGWPSWNNHAVTVQLCYEVRIDCIKWQRFTKHLELPPLYQKFEPRSESTSFRKHSFDKS